MQVHGKTMLVNCSPLLSSYGREEESHSALQRRRKDLDELVRAATGIDCFLELAGGLMANLLEQRLNQLPCPIP